MSSETKVVFLGGLIILSVILFVVSLVFLKEDYERKAIPDSISVIEYDGCEYLVTVRSSAYGSTVGLAHKGNCKYCAGRLIEAEKR